MLVSARQIGVTTPSNDVLIAVGGLMRVSGGGSKNFENQECFRLLWNNQQCYGEWLPILDSTY